MEIPPPRPRRARRVGVAAAIGAAIVGGILVQQRRADEPVPGRVGVLERPIGDRDQLPAWVADDEALHLEGIEWPTVRLARVDPGRRWFIARATGPGPRGGPLRRICLIAVPDDEPDLPAPSAFLGASAVTGRLVAGYVCGRTDALRNRFVAFRTSRVSPSDVVGIVPDGHDRVRAGRVESDVRGNVFVLREPTGPDPLIATGSAGERRAFAGLSTAPTPPSFTTPGLPVRISALDRPIRPEDRLPEEVRFQLRALAGEVRSEGIVPGSERLISNRDGHRYWLVRDRVDRRVLGLVDADTDGRVGYQVLTAPSAGDAVNGVVVSSQSEPFGPSVVRGWLLVPDGLTSATVGGRPVPLLGNALVFAETLDSGATVVELRGPAGVVRRSVGDATAPTQPMSPLPTNHIPLKAVVALREAAGPRAGALRSAVITAGSAAQVERVTGRLVPSGSRLVWLLMAADGDRTLVVVADSLDRDGFEVVQRFRVREPLDLTPLTRVRPLDLGR